MDLSKSGELRAERVDKDPFEAFADDWWDPKGRLKSLHTINPLRFGYYKEKVNNLNGLKVLDVGCGGGLLSEKFAEEGALVTGIDLSPVSINAAKKHAEESGLKIDYRHCSITDLVKEEDGFDAVICAEVLEHVDDLEGFIKDCAGFLKAGGCFFFSTLNKTFRSRFFAIYVAEDILGMVPQGTHDYSRFIKPSTLTKILKENAIAVQDLAGLTFEPLSLGFKLSKSLSINYLGYGIKE
jgi:2-polyprenyl-6-hydroxyphenyl methylase/3-demethylubiquinone-9 3-methyltransferase